ncbi:hypothetical protein M885DRAFT_616068, partial [Pelagophyceae sp. CCMP2097]
MGSWQKAQDCVAGAAYPDDIELHRVSWSTYDVAAAHCRTMRTIAKFTQCDVTTLLFYNHRSAWDNLDALEDSRTVLALPPQATVPDWFALKLEARAWRGSSKRHFLRDQRLPRWDDVVASDDESSVEADYWHRRHAGRQDAAGKRPQADDGEAQRPAADRSGAVTPPAPSQSEGSGRPRKRAHSSLEESPPAAKKPAGRFRCKACRSWTPKTSVCPCSTRRETRRGGVAEPLPVRLQKLAERRDVPVDAHRRFSRPRATSCGAPGGAPGGRAPGGGAADADWPTEPLRDDAPRGDDADAGAGANASVSPCASMSSPEAGVGCIEAALRGAICFAKAADRLPDATVAPDREAPDDCDLWARVRDDDPPLSDLGCSDALRAANGVGDRAQERLADGWLDEAPLPITYSLDQATRTAAAALAKAAKTPKEIAARLSRPVALVQAWYYLFFDHSLLQTKVAERRRRTPSEEGDSEFPDGNRRNQTEIKIRLRGTASWDVFSSQRRAAKVRKPRRRQRCAAIPDRHDGPKCERHRRKRYTPGKALAIVLGKRVIPERAPSHPRCGTSR